LTLTYYFDSQPQESSKFSLNNTYLRELNVKVTSNQGHSLVLDPVNFIWNHPQINLPPK